MAWANLPGIDSTRMQDLNEYHSRPNLFQIARAYRKEFESLMAMHS